MKHLFSGVSAKWLTRLVLLCYVGMVLLLIVATFVDSAAGAYASSEAGAEVVFEAGMRVASEAIYRSGWFQAWWGVLGVMLLLALCRCRGAEAHLHCSLVMILLGAGLTSLTAHRGVVYLQPDLAVDRYLDAEHHRILALPFTLQLDSMRVVRDPGTEQHADYISYLHVDSVPMTVSMNRVTTVKGYRLIPYSYDEVNQVSWLSVNHDPWGIGVTYLGYLWYAIAFMSLLRRHWGVVLLALLAGGGLQLYAGSTPLMPVLRSAWLGIHVSFIVMAYTLFAFLAVHGAMALCLPARREVLMQQSLRLLRPAEGMLGLGIFMGAVWANQSWGRYWAWDAKEVWALITFMLYALPFHHRRIGWLRQPLRFHLFLLGAFLSVLFTYFGCNYLLAGLHSYVG